MVKKVWANQILENGLDGGDTDRKNYNPHTEESKKKMSETNKGKVPWNKGKKGATPGNKTLRSEETKKLLREANLGKKQSKETIDKRIEKLNLHKIRQDFLRMENLLRFLKKLPRFIKVFIRFKTKIMQDFYLIRFSKNLLRILLNFGKKGNQMSRDLTQIGQDCSVNIL